MGFELMTSAMAVQSLLRQLEAMKSLIIIKESTIVRVSVVLRRTVDIDRRRCPFDPLRSLLMISRRRYAEDRKKFC